MKNMSIIWAEKDKVMKLHFVENLQHVLKMK